jgi:hypothetical protein
VKQKTLQRLCAVPNKAMLLQAMDSELLVVEEDSDEELTDAELFSKQAVLAEEMMQARKLADSEDILDAKLQIGGPRNIPPVV